MLAALVGGLTNAQIGNRLHISGAHGRGVCVLVAAQVRVADRKALVEAAETAVPADQVAGVAHEFRRASWRGAEVVAPALGVTQSPHQPLDEIIASATFDLATLSVALRVIRAVLRSSRS